MPGMTEPYLREKFNNALSGLVTGAGKLSERVRNAMVILVMFTPEDMPDKFSREQFAKLSYLSTDCEASGDEGDLAATLEAMPTEDVQGLAETILILHDHLLRRVDERFAAEQGSDTSG
jgi:hypothetical protein